MTSVLLHAVNTGLVFLLLRGLTGAVWRSVWVAALFAVHPLRVEAVAWVAGGRKEMLCDFFGLLALMAYARYAEKSVVSGQRSVIGSQSSRMPGTDNNGPRITDHRLISRYCPLPGLIV